MTSLYTAQMKHRRGLTFWGQWLCALSLVNLLLVMLVYERVGSLTSEYRVLMILTVLGSVPIYSVMQVYHKRHEWLSGLGRLLAAWMILLAVLISIAFVTQTSVIFSRQVIIVWAVLGYLIQAMSFLPLHYVARLHSHKLCNERRAVIIGTCPTAQKLAKKLTRPNRVPLLGFIATPDHTGPAPSILPLLGRIDEVREIITRLHIRRVYIVLPMAQAAIIEALYIDLLDMNVDVVWIPDFGSMVLLNQSISEIERMPAIYLNESLISSHPGSLLCKELFERSLAAVGIIVLSPLLLIVAAAVKLSSPGPVLFIQNRYGWNAEVINVWKFRSMRVHDDEVRQATREDDRITPLGRFLRRSSIDELPQLFNVLFGEMALVGPRPHAVTHNIYYTGKVCAYMARHRLKPGITGLAQITGHRGETQTLEKMQQRVAQDLNYINQWSLWLDIKILVKTPFTLFSKDIY